MTNRKLRRYFFSGVSGRARAWMVLFMAAIKLY